MLFNKILKENLDIEWKEYYIDYDSLKVYIENIIKNKQGYEKLFSKKLDEYWKIHEEFVLNKINEIKSKKITKQLFSDIMRLNDFINLNQNGFKKIIKKHDKNSKYKLYPAWKFKIGYNPISKIYYIIKEISKLYPHFNDIDTKEKIQNKEFKRKSIKYWVSNRNLLKVIHNIIEHLPIYIFDEDINDHIYQYISSVYFDNKNLELYHERTVKKENSNIIRIRWYESDESTLFVEKKTHHEDWTKLSSIKERFTIKSNKILSYLRNDIVIDNDLAKNIFEIIKSRNLYPLVRTVYKRISFQLKNNDDVRISLDLDLRFIRERTSQNEWFTNIEDIEEDDIIYFPFSILEIKLKNENIQNPPNWVRNLMESNLIIKKEKFSKFSHGTYSFYNHKCNIEPYWFNNYDFYKIENNEIEIKIDNNKTNKYLKCVKCNNKKIIANPVKIEPKTFFANERTFMQWFNSAMFVGSMGIAIGKLENGLSMSYILLLLSLFIILYSCFTYYSRNRKLKMKDGDGYDDLYGPIILSFITLMAFISSLLIR